MIYSDVRLLSVFDTVYKTKSISRAAEMLGLGQPTVSIALAKLRRHFKDVLFVRTAAGMEATPLAEELVDPVRVALDALEKAFGHRSVFVPGESQRSFRICMSDITQVSVLPKVWPHLAAQAPGVGIEVLPAINAESAGHLLAEGEADLAIGVMPQLEAGFYQQALFRQRYVVLASADHPRVREGVTREHLETERHAVFATSATGHLIIEEVFRREGIRRQVALTTPNFISGAFVCERTDLLMVFPEGLGNVIRQRGDFRLFPLPFDVPDIVIKQHWHRRMHADPGHRWLRALIAQHVTTP